MKSKCCGAEVKSSLPAPDFIGNDPDTMTIGTCYYICCKCNKACDAVYDARLTDEQKKIILYYIKRVEELQNEYWNEHNTAEKLMSKYAKLPATDILWSTDDGIIGIKIWDKQPIFIPIEDLQKGNV